MTNASFKALMASLGVALSLAAGAAVAGPATPHGTAFRPAHGQVTPFRHHRGGVAGGYWPGDYYDPSYGAPLADVAPAPAASGDVHYTYTYDVPWDWVHRLPPQVAPSDHPYVPSCPT